MGPVHIPNMPEKCAANCPPRPLHLALDLGCIEAEAGLEGLDIAVAVSDVGVVEKGAGGARTPCATPPSIPVDHRIELRILRIWAGSGIWPDSSTQNSSFAATPSAVR